MHAHRIFRLLAVLFLATLCVVSQAQDLQAIPPLQSRVTDMVGMLNAEQRQALEKTLQAYETAKGSQIAVLLVKSTEPETIEQYSIRVVDTWKLGRKGIEDGVLLLVAKDNPPSLNRLRIEAGRGTEGVLTDALSKRILQEVIAPHFRKGDFYGGLSAGVSAIMATLDKEGFAAPEQSKKDETSASSWLPLLIMVFFFILVIRSRRRNELLTGMLLGGAMNPHGRRRYDDDDFGGGFGGGGGFGDGGGFSGGGGGFSGGGASGNW